VRRLRTVSILGAIALAVAIVGAPASPAQAPAPSPTPSPTVPTSDQSVTIEVTKTSLKYGASTTVKGFVSSAEYNETVTLYDDDEKELAETVTTENGKYEFTYKPKTKVTIHTVWESATSDSVSISVRASAHTGLSEVHLFDHARVSGSVKPANAGDRPTVTLRRGAKVVAKKNVKVGSGGKYSAKFAINKPGKYSAKVVYKPSGLLPGKAVSAKHQTRTPSLNVGSKGTYVNLLEKRLRKLHYYLTEIDHYYDERTSDAVLAFNKVQGRPRVGNVTAATWRALSTPKRPKSRGGGGTHIEVDQTKQVFYQVKGGRIVNILHTSTGANNATRDGHFRVYRKGGAGREFYPSYFDGARAFHVWADVPPSSASAGCIRLAYWTRNWYWRNTPIGTPVIIYH
jgi:hypothetical protein